MQLSTWIIDGTLQPGEALRDLDIAGRLGVSRTPVREALRRLEDEGLIETALNRWTRVAPLDAARAADLYPVVEALEMLALRLAMPALTGPDITHLRDLNAQLGAALQHGDARAAVEADMAFHGVWTERAGNRELHHTLHALKRKLRRIELAYFHAGSAGTESVEEHAVLLHALHAGDVEASVRALHANWQGSLRRLQHSGLGLT
ncbi:putative transcriptional regulator, GntR family protein [Deinococcus metalli]|nr:putative transcriptional regulator, GntR family protein [Deinococcus metalli]